MARSQVMARSPDLAIRIDRRPPRYQLTNHFFSTLLHPAMWVFVFANSSSLAFQSRSLFLSLKEHNCVDGSV